MQNALREATPTRSPRRSIRDDFSRQPGALQSYRRLLEDGHSNAQRELRGIVVVSLCSGGGAGLVALIRLGIKIDCYIGVEKDQICRRHLNSTCEKYNIPHFIHSDVYEPEPSGRPGRRALDAGTLQTLLTKAGCKGRSIDLVMFGSPCQDISRANATGSGIGGKHSGIFFICLNIVSAATKVNKCLGVKKPLLLAENVIPNSMNEGIMVGALRCFNNNEPIPMLKMNSLEVGPFSRLRMWMTTLAPVIEPAEFNAIHYPDGVIANGSGTRNHSWFVDYTHEACGVDDKTWAVADGEHWECRGKFGGFMHGSTSSSSSIKWIKVTNNDDESVLRSKPLTGVLRSMDRQLLMGLPSNHFDSIRDDDDGDKKKVAICGNGYVNTLRVFVFCDPSCVHP